MTLALVLRAIFEIFGALSGGSSSMKSLVGPLIKTDMILPTAMNSRNMIPAMSRTARRESAAARASMTPSCAEQGTASARSATTMIRSFFVSSIRLARVAIVTHPKPSTIGSVALPLTPTKRKALFVRTVRRGKYPVSSRIPKARKKTVTMGSTIDIE